jgi:Ca-activated chloride channel family protein
MRFGNEDVLKLFFILMPLFIYFFYKIYVILNNYKKFLDSKIQTKIFYKISLKSIILKYFSLFLAFFFFTLALARPLGEPIKTEMEFKGIDIMVLVDVSSSMAAIDIVPNRMEAIKKGLKEFLDLLTGDRIGIITFAGVDFVQCPLTIDYDAVDLIIDGIYPGMLFKDGTYLGNAIKSAIERLEIDAGKSKVLILITDGENTGGISPLDAAKIAKEKGIRIYTIGVGTKEGGKIPEGTDFFGRTYFKTYQGEVVISKLNDSELKQIASITDGKYYRLTDANLFKSIVNDIKNIEENKTKIKKTVKYKENYQKFLLWGLIFYLISAIIGIENYLKINHKATKI